jgi:hypothetical protein
MRHDFIGVTEILLSGFAYIKDFRIEESGIA